MTKKVRQIVGYLLIALTAVQANAQANNIEVINIENPAVHAYMADSTYFNNPKYGVTVVKNYYDTQRYGDYLDRPQGKKVNWTSTLTPDSILELRISVSENRDFTQSAIHFPDSLTATTYVIKNMIPNRTYYYKVEEMRPDSSLNVLTQGVFRTEGQVRMIEVQRARNVRDLGGWNSAWGGTVRYGRLYRSANLDRIKATGRHEFAGNLNVGAELDLRAGSRLKASALGEDKDFLLEPLPVKGGLVKNGHLYARYLTWIVERLRDGKNVDWHCAIGCDRCGKVSFMIEGLLGLSEQDLCRDFELSTFSNRFRPRSHIKYLVDEVKKFGEEDDSLTDCFVKLWLSFGVLQSDIDYLLDTMIEPNDKN